MADGTLLQPNKRQMAKAATCRAVMEAGEALFFEVGYEAATIRAIAKRAGMSTGAVFANFTDKRDLYHHVFGHDPVTPEQGRLLMLALRAECDAHAAPIMDPATPQVAREARVFSSRILGAIGTMVVYAEDPCWPDADKTSRAGEGL